MVLQSALCMIMLKLSTRSEWCHFLLWKCFEEYCRTSYTWQMVQVAKSFSHEMINSSNYWYKTKVTVLTCTVLSNSLLERGCVFPGNVLQRDGISPDCFSKVIRSWIDTLCQNAYYLSFIYSLFPSPFLLYRLLRYVIFLTFAYKISHELSLPSCCIFAS